MTTDNKTRLVNQLRIKMTDNGVTPTADMVKRVCSSSPYYSLCAERKYKVKGFFNAFHPVLEDYCGWDVYFDDVYIDSAWAKSSTDAIALIRESEDLPKKAKRFKVFKSLD